MSHLSGKFKDNIPELRGFLRKIIKEGEPLQAHLGKDLINQINQEKPKYMQKICLNKLAILIKYLRDYHTFKRKISSHLGAHTEYIFRKV